MAPRNAVPLTLIALLIVAGGFFVVRTVANSGEAAIEYMARWVVMIGGELCGPPGAHRSAVRLR